MKPIFLLLPFLFCFSLFAAEPIKVKSIEIQGNKKTHSDVLLREMNLPLEKPLSAQEIETSINRLRNTNLFAKVRSQISMKNGQKVVEVSVDEKWTTIPIFKVASGGGVSHLTLGVYDPNTLGKYLEVGGQYEKLGDAQSGVFWFKNPRLFGKRQGIDIQVWNTSRLNTTYVQGPEDPEVFTGFLQKRQKVYLGYNREWSDRFNLRSYLEYNEDNFSDDFVTDEVKSRLVSTGLPEATSYSFIGMGADWGLVNNYDFLQNGSKLTWDYRYGFSGSKDQGFDDFWQTELKYGYYKTLGGKSTFAQRVMAGMTSAEAIQYSYYLGGLDRVRGFADNRFSGKYFLLSNTEYRRPVWQNKWAVVQGVGFLDLVSTSEDLQDLDTLDGASIGGGLRVILPKVYRFVVRFDYAQPIKRSDDINFSFGVQQFF